MIKKTMKKRLGIFLCVIQLIMISTTISGCNKAKKIDFQLQTEDQSVATTKLKDELKIPDHINEEIVKKSGSQRYIIDADINVVDASSMNLYQVSVDDMIIKENILSFVNEIYDKNTMKRVVPYCYRSMDELKEELERIENTKQIADEEQYAMLIHLERMVSDTIDHYSDIHRDNFDEEDWSIVESDDEYEYLTCDYACMREMEFEGEICGEQYYTKVTFFLYKDSMNSSIDGYYDFEISRDPLELYCTLNNNAGIYHSDENTKKNLCDCSAEDGRRVADDFMNAIGLNDRMAVAIYDVENYIPDEQFGDEKKVLDGYEYVYSSVLDSAHNLYTGGCALYKADENQDILDEDSIKNYGHADSYVQSGIKGYGTKYAPIDEIHVEVDDIGVRSVSISPFIYRNPRISASDIELLSYDQIEGIAREELQKQVDSVNVPMTINIGEICLGYAPVAYDNQIAFLPVWIYYDYKKTASVDVYNNMKPVLILNAIDGSRIDAISMRDAHIDAEEAMSLFEE